MLPVYNHHACVYAVPKLALNLLAYNIKKMKMCQSLCVSEYVCACVSVPKSGMP